MRKKVLSCNSSIRIPVKAAKQKVRETLSFYLLEAILFTKNLFKRPIAQASNPS